MKSTRISYEIQFPETGERSRRALATRCIATRMARDYESFVRLVGHEASDEHELQEFILLGCNSWGDYGRQMYSDNEQIASLFLTPKQFERSTRPPKNRTWDEILEEAIEDAYNDMLLPLYRKKDWKEPTVM